MGQDIGKPLGHIIVRYMLVGAGLGLYLGISFRPVEREANFFTPIMLAVLGAIVLVIFRYISGARPNLAGLAKMLLTSFALFAFFFLIMELRYQALDLGGRWLVIAFTTVAGVVNGIIYAYGQSRAIV